MITRKDQPEDLILKYYGMRLPTAFPGPARLMLGNILKNGKVAVPRNDDGEDGIFLTVFCRPIKRADDTARHDHDAYYDNGNSVCPIHQAANEHDLFPPIIKKITPFGFLKAASVQPFRHPWDKQCIIRKERRYPQ